MFLITLQISLSIHGEGRGEVLFRYYQPETITVNIHYFYAAVFLKVLTQLGYIYVHTAAVEISITAPNALQCGIARQQVVLICAQHQQQFIFFWRKGLRIAIMFQRTQLAVEMIAAEVEFYL